MCRVCFIYPKIQGQRTVFAEDYVVVPQSHLEKLCSKKRASGGVYSFYFHNMENCLYERRDGQVDMTKYHNAWNLI